MTIYHHPNMLFSALSSCLVLLPSTSALQLSDYRLQKVYEVMSAISSQSYVLLLLHPGLGPLRPPLPSSPLDRFTDVLRWENGTKAEAILEHDYPSFSVYSPTPALPLPNPLQSSAIQSIISIAQTTLQNRPATNTSAKASAGISLLTDGSAGDPASLGFAVLLANASTGNAQVNGVGYGDAATAELAYMLNDVPRVIRSDRFLGGADEADIFRSDLASGRPSAALVRFRLHGASHHIPPYPR